MFDYEVFTEEECLNLLPAGNYRAEILELVNTRDDGSKLVSAKGVPMLKLKLKVMAPQGNKDLFDYILLNKTWAFKFRHAADSIGKIEDYTNKTLKPSDFLSAMCVVTVGVQDAKDGYQAKNNIVDYVKLADQQNSVKEEPKKDEFVDDEIPF